MIINSLSLKRKSNKTGKDKKSCKLAEFEGIFLKPNKLNDRKQVYISTEVYEKMISYISIISDRKLSTVGYIDNILAHHMETYISEINELYDKKACCKLNNR